MSASGRLANRVIVFDLDGTLIDSIGDIASSANQSLIEAYGEKARLSQEVIRSFVGSGARQLIERCVAKIGHGSDDIPAVFNRFLAIYRERLSETTRLYPGMDEALTPLGLAARLAVLTNKPGDMSRTILRELKLTHRFIAVLGGDDLKSKKPDPEGLLKIAADAGVEARDVFMIGDSAIDMQTARNAGAVGVGVGWGYDREGVVQEKPDLFVEKTSDLFNALMTV